MPKKSKKISKNKEKTAKKEENKVQHENEGRNKNIKQKKVFNTIISASADESSDRREIILPRTLRKRNGQDYSFQRTPIDQHSMNSAFKNYEDDNQFEGEQKEENNDEN